MRKMLGIDTSNYTTSAAVYAQGQVEQNKRLLPVREGQLGLRQSDAVFHHVQQLPGVLEPLLTGHAGWSAVGASIRPRDVEGSYMPCFTVGQGAGQTLANALGVPFHTFSHQAGHIAAALYSAGRLDLLEQEFLAYQVSGGTTEAVLVQPDARHVFSCRVVASSLDLKGGQAVDRVGVMLGLPFPAGRDLEALALQGETPCPVRPTMKGADFCLSGLENQCRVMQEQGRSAPEIARYCLEVLTASLRTSCEQLRREYGDLPLVFAGGVTSNSILRETLTEQCGAFFAAPEFSTDNAAGIAILTAVREGAIA